MQGGVTSPAGVSGSCQHWSKDSGSRRSKKGSLWGWEGEAGTQPALRPMWDACSPAGGASRSIQCRRQRRFRHPGWPGLEGQIVQRSKMKLRAHGVGVLRLEFSLELTQGGPGLRRPRTWDPARPGPCPSGAWAWSCHSGAASGAPQMLEHVFEDRE